MHNMTTGEDGYRFFWISENLEYGYHWIREDQLNSIDPYAGMGKYEITYDHYKTGYMYSRDANVFMAQGHPRCHTGFNCDGWWDLNAGSEGQR
jgi:hypothetical protein